METAVVLTVAVTVVTGATALAGFAHRQLVESAGSLSSEAGAADGLVGATRSTVLGLIAAMLPLVGSIVAGATATGWLQTRGAISWKAAAPRWSNLSPAAGLKRLVGLDGAVTLLRSALKLAVIGSIAFAVLSSSRNDVLALSGAGPSVLVFYERGHEEVCELMQDIFQKHGHGSEIMWSHIPDHGYDLLRGL